MAKINAKTKTGSHTGRISQENTLFLVTMSSFGLKTLLFAGFKELERGCDMRSYFARLTTEKLKLARMDSTPDHRIYKRFAFSENFLSP